MDQLESLQSLILKKFNCVEVLQCSLSPALAVHSGPGTVGINFFPD
jgi:fatty acid-binding protein DegV